MTWRILLPMLALLAGTLAAFADPVFPVLTGRVVDGANLLDAAQEEALTRKLEALEEKTSDQFVIVTLPSLQGWTIEEFGVRLGRHWAIGQKDKNNGVLLIVAPEERKTRIEVGYGLEGVLTDALSRVIIETSILPRFRAGDMAGGITAGAEDIITVLSGGAGEIEQRALSRPESSDDIFEIIFPLVIFIIIVLIFILIIRGGGGSSGSWSSSSGRSSGSSWSGSSGGFSGGGGSFGGGGSSGSW
jgi:uncharacterized protein